MKKVWVATAVDTSDTSDGKAWTIGVYERKEDADKDVQADIDDYINDLEQDGKQYIRRPLSVMTQDGDYGCEWNVEQVKFVKSGVAA